MSSSIKNNPYCDFSGCSNIKKIGCGRYCWDHREHDPGFARKEADKARKQDAKKLRLLSDGKQGSGYSNEDNKLVDNAGAQRIKSLTEFFKEAAVEIAKDPRCWECKAKIDPWDYRNATAHILPKGIFHSIETHPLCYVVANTRCGCHGKTHRMDTFAKMKIFPLAVSRFRQFEHLITEKHKLLDEFLKYANLIIL